MQTFKPKNGLISNLLFVYLLLLAIPLIMLINREPWDVFLKVTAINYGLVTLVLYIIQISTRYKIKDGNFHYRSLVFFGKIAITKIHKLDVGKTLYVGMKPATAKKGIIIHYNRYEEVYISPEDNAAFVAALLAINPAIEVHYHPKPKGINKESLQ